MIALTRGIAAALGCAALCLLAPSAAQAEIGLDPSYAGDGVFETVYEGGFVTEQSLAADGDRAVIAALIRTSNGETLPNVLRLNGAGAPDETFDGNGVVKLRGELADRHVSGVAVGPTSDVFVLLAPVFFNSSPGVVHLGSDGALDATYAGDGLLDLPVGSEAFAVDGAGRLLAAATEDDDIALYRYASDGRPDDGFGSGGRVAAGATSAVRAEAVVATTDLGACASGQSAGFVSTFCVDEAGTVTMPPDGEPVLGATTSNGELAAVPGGRYVSSFSYASTNYGSSFGSSALSQAFRFPGEGAGPTKGYPRAIAAVGADRALIAGSSTTGPGSSWLPAFVLVDTTERRDAPVDSWLASGTGTATDVLDVATDSADRPLALLSGDTNTLAIARLAIDESVDPRDRPELRLGRLRAPDGLGALLRRGARFSALCTADCSLRAELVVSRRAAKSLGLRNRVVDRFRGPLTSGIKYVVRMSVRGGVARKARRAAMAPADLGLRVRSQVDFRP